MSEYNVSDRLLRTRLVSKGSQPEDDVFASGTGTRAATQAFLKQAASRAAGFVVAKAARARPTSEERRKEILRRRKWAGGGNMPPEVRNRYSEAERAALSVIANECKIKGSCALCIDEIARIAGVSRTSVQNAIRRARSADSDGNWPAHITVRERPQVRGKSLTNVIKVVCRSWLGWLARAIGFKRLNTSESPDRISLSQQAESSKVAFEKEAGDFWARSPAESMKWLRVSKFADPTTIKGNFSAEFQHRHPAKSSLLTGLKFRNSGVSS